MHPSLSSLRDGLLASLLIKPRGNPLLAGPGAFVLALAVYFAIQAFVSSLDTPPPRMILGWGVSQVLADSLLTLIAAWALVRMAGRSGIVWSVSAIALAATAWTSLVVHWPLQYLASLAFAHGNHPLSATLLWVSLAWWFLVLVRLAIWLMPRRLPRALPVAMLAYALSAMPWWWLPGAPLITHDEAQAQLASEASSDVIVDSGFENSAGFQFDPERLMFDQPYRLTEAIDALRPRVPGKTNLYVVAFAGDGSENVFRNEVEYVERLFSERFDAQGHVIVLENNPASIEARPLATLTNLGVALDAIAERMDPAEDILLVYLTSHGSRDHQFYVALDPLPLNQIVPEDLVDALDTSPSLRWKVLIVNACYSGGFIDALRDDSTMVITAARSDRTSFGCGSESEITYFGKAFLAEALNETNSFPEAFELAVKKVAEWEALEQGAERSEPQIASSRSIEAKLQKWRLGLPPAPAVEFSPAAAIDSEP
jgi:hypothetical protein